MFQEQKQTQIKRMKLSDIISDELENMIYDGQLKAGEKLPSENELAKHFGVSRNVVRESLICMEERGLVVVEAGKGAFIDISESKGLNAAVARIIKLQKISLENVYEVRSALEATACRLCASRATDLEISELVVLAESMEYVKNIHSWVSGELDFHMTIIKGSKNELFYHFAKQLTNQLSDLFREVYSSNEYRQFAVGEHREVVRAIQERDENKAERLMRKHLEQSRRFITGC